MQFKKPYCGTKTLVGNLCAKVVPKNIGRRLSSKNSSWELAQWHCTSSPYGHWFVSWMLHFGFSSLFMIWEGPGEPKSLDPHSHVGDLEVSGSWLPVLDQTNFLPLQPFGEQSSGQKLSLSSLIFPFSSLYICLSKKKNKTDLPPRNIHKFQHILAPK